MDYLAGGHGPKAERGVLIYKAVFCTLAIVGAVWAIAPVLNFSDAMMGLMAFPNLLAIWLLLPKLRAETKDYFGRLAAGKFPEQGRAQPATRNRVADNRA